MLPLEIRARDPRRAARERRRRLPHEPLAAELHALGEDIVGASADWARDVVGYEGRRTLVTAAPISIDPTEFDELRRATAVLEREARLESGRPEKLILRVDRTDPSKNIVRGFRAFELFLDAHPEWHGRV